MSSNPLSVVDLGAKIKAVRLKHNLIQQAFADSLGIAQGYLSELEKGIKKPSDTLLIALSHLYEINMDWLIGGKGEMSYTSVKQSLNLEFMREVIEIAEKIFAHEKAKLTPGKKAKLIILLYETLLKEEAEFKGKSRESFLAQNAIKFLKLAT